MVIHRLKDIDPVHRIATCSVCGPGVSVRLRSDNNKWRCQTSERYRDINRKYGLTKDQFDAMVKSSGGRCEICNEPLIIANVDHDHKTGIVRGLLCSNCNTALGLFKDSTTNLASAIIYLEESK